MNTLPIASAVVTTAYVAYIINRYKGIPTSISESFYLLGEDENARLLFDAWTILAGAPIMFYMTEHSEGYLKVFGWLTGLGLMIVGYAPRFKVKPERYIHFAATGLAAACSIWWSLKTGGSLLKVLIMLIAAVIVGSNVEGVTRTNGKHNTIMFFLEIGAFANLYTHTIR
jgi:hypothetical protein